MVLSAALTGCSAVSSGEAVATFNGAELGRDEFDAQYTVRAGGAVDGRLLADTARDVVTDWILLQILDEGGIVEFYETGPAASGMICVSLIRTADTTEAEGLVERLDGGADWSTLLAEEYPDVPANGDVECLPTESLGPLATQVTGLTLDSPYTVFQFDDQSSAVLRMRPASQVPPLELAGLTQAVAPERVAGLDALIEGADVTVDPTIGRFDADAGGVVPVG